MKLFFILINLIFYGIQLSAQSSINHIVEITPETQIINQTIEIRTKAEYLFKIDKELKGKTVSISPKNYKVIEGGQYNFLLFDSPKIEVVYTEKIPEDKFRVSSNGVYTVGIDFNYNYLNQDNKVDYDPTTNNSVSSTIQINGDYEILNYRFNPDIQGKEMENNQIRFKGNVNKMRVEIDYVLRKNEFIELSKNKKVVLEKEVAFNDMLTLSVWDDVQEDGDIISLWLGEICLAKNLKVSKEKVSYKITKEMFGSENTLNIRIDNVDEGAIPPNTVLIELRGKGVDENLRINTTDKLSKKIVLRKN